jgi:hypothetical protein
MNTPLLFIHFNMKSVPKNHIDTKFWNFCSLLDKIMYRYHPYVASSLNSCFLVVWLSYEFENIK